MNQSFLPYSRHLVDEHDIEAVVDVLNSSWLTTGCKVIQFEEAVAGYCGAKYAVAVSSGTAALHCAAFAAGIGPGDEVIVPAITFAATANCVSAQGAIPIVVDIDPDTLLIDTLEIESHVSDRTKAIIAVDYAGQPCNYDILREIADFHGLTLIADSCHALGSSFKSVRTGSLADLTVFSFHPAKHITTGEGGMVVTNNSEYAEKIRRFRNHGISSDLHQRKNLGSWFYEVEDLGFNYRISDIQCALGLSQLEKLDGWIERRRNIAEKYTEFFGDEIAIRLLGVQQQVKHSYHLYVVRLNTEHLKISRTDVFKALHEQGIGVNVHYIPLNLHSYYQKRYGTKVGQCPEAESAYNQILSLPIFPALSDQEIDIVIDKFLRIITANRN